MRLSILPKVRLGKWSFGLGVAWVLFFALASVLAGFNSGLGLPLRIMAAVIGAGALVTGLIDVIKDKERAILVFVAMAIGLYGLTGAAAIALAA
jgi:hypothetical protein